MMVSIAVALSLALCAGGTEPAGAQVRDGASTAPGGTAAISGTIMTDDAAPRPVRHATVTLNSLDRVIGRTAISDDEGRFAFANLPQGRYSLTAQKLGWVSGAYGAKAVGRPGRTLPLANGERVTASIRMARGAVITGTILDQFGQPVAGATVRAMKNGYSISTGERLLNPVGVSGSPDERGAYRIYGLAPGDYYISVTNAAPPSTGGRDLHLTSEVDVQDALKTSSQPISAPAADVPQPTVGFAQVFYPGTTSVPQATPITVKAGEERTGVDVAVTYTSTTHVSGTVRSPLGTPVPAVVFLADPASRFAGAYTVAHATSGPDGRFTFSDIVPGPYVMTAHDMVPPASPAEHSQHTGTSSDLDVPPDGVTGLTIALQDALTVSGMLKYDGASPGPDLSSLRVELRQDGVGVLARNSGGPTTAADGRFTLSGVLPGRYRVVVNLPGPPQRWRLSSATLLGQDALDNAADVRQNVTDGVITITDQLSTLTGTLASAGVASDYTLILFSTDRRQWRPLSRRILTSRAAGDATFSFANVPPGDYWLAAIDDVEPGEWFDPTFLQRIEPTAIKMTIGESEKKTQDLHVGGEQDRGQV
jgi:protocatechuate 3,4-dioxygenase beta subunit